MSLPFLMRPGRGAVCLFLPMPVVALLVLLLPGLPATRVGAQTSTAQQQQIADRFLQVLQRRPRVGTALDRVYGHHVQNGT
ncbi:MAG: hypothetical protein AAGD07_12835, partial [Planctomycetota bacterium]